MNPDDARQEDAGVARIVTGAGYWTTVAVESLGLRSLRMSDGPHGLRIQDDDNPDHLGLGRSLPATCFPAAVTMACSWDLSLIEAVGAACGKEARAKNVDILLGPGLNLKRSPLCGRNFEYYSEDPLLAGQLAGAMIRGVQSQGVAATPKHFAANNQETDRMTISADIDPRPLHELYLRAFQIAIREGAPWAIMTAYNGINGVPATSNPWLLTELLRKEWGFDGLTISDWGAVHDPVASLAAGLDMRMPGKPDDPTIALALAAGELCEDDIFTVVDRLKLLAERTAPGIAPEDCDYAAHDRLTRYAAAQSAVLLHNDQSLLPLSAEGNIALIGEFARVPRYQGAGSSAVNPRRTVSALDAMSERFSSLSFAPGFRLDGEPDQALQDEAVLAASNADTVILFLGLPAISEAEGRDRTDIDLPDNQRALIDAVSAVHSRVIVALSNGAVIATTQWRSKVGAIIEFWLTGQAHGETVADVLTGEVNPSGKLAETIPLRLEDTPSYLSFPGEAGHARYAEGIFVGYRHYDARDAAVDYPFGHGLSYTRFEYSDMKVEVNDIDDEMAFAITATIANVGERDGAEVAQLYVGTQDNALRMPVRELKGFAKVHLKAGETASITIDVRRSDLAHYHPGHGWSMPGGKLAIALGASSRDLRLQAFVDVPGHAISKRLDLYSTFGDWLDHPSAGDMVRSHFEQRGGLSGRIADLLASDVSAASIREAPLIAVLQFPGVPLEEADVERILGHLDDQDRVQALEAHA